MSVASRSANGIDNRLPGTLELENQELREECKANKGLFLSSGFKLQLQTMFIDTSLNSVPTVLANLHQAFSNSALRCYEYVRVLSRSRPTHPQLLISKLSHIVIPIVVHFPVFHWFSLHPPVFRIRHPVQICFWGGARQRPFLAHCRSSHMQRFNIFCSYYVLVLHCYFRGIPMVH